LGGQPATSAKGNYKELCDYKCKIYYRRLAKMSITPNSPKIITLDIKGESAALLPGTKVVEGEVFGLEPATTGDVPAVPPEIGFKGARAGTGADGPCNFGVALAASQNWV
jgi:hypothetical protein